MTRENTNKSRLSLPPPPAGLTTRPPRPLSLPNPPPRDSHPPSRSQPQVRQQLPRPHPPSDPPEAPSRNRHSYPLPQKMVSEGGLPHHHHHHGKTRHPTNNASRAGSSTSRDVHPHPQRQPHPQPARPRSQSLVQQQLQPQPQQEGPKSPRYYKSIYDRLTESQATAFELGAAYASSLAGFDSLEDFLETQRAMARERLEKQAEEARREEQRRISGKRALEASFREELGNEEEQREELEAMDSDEEDARNLARSGISLEGYDTGSPSKRRKTTNSVVAVAGSGSSAWGSDSVPVAKGIIINSSSSKSRRSEGQSPLKSKGKSSARGRKHRQQQDGSSSDSGLVKGSAPIANPFMPGDSPSKDPPPPPQPRGRRSQLVEGLEEQPLQHEDDDQEADVPASSLGPISSSISRTLDRNKHLRRRQQQHHHHPHNASSTTAVDGPFDSSQVTRLTDSSFFHPDHSEVDTVPTSPPPPLPPRDDHHHEGDKEKKTNASAPVPATIDKGKPKAFSLTARKAVFGANAMGGKTRAGAPGVTTKSPIKPPSKTGILRPEPALEEQEEQGAWEGSPSMLEQLSSGEHPTVKNTHILIDEDESGEDDELVIHPPPRAAMGKGKGMGEESVDDPFLEVDDQNPDCAADDHLLYPLQEETEEEEEVTEPGKGFPEVEEDEDLQEQEQELDQESEEETFRARQEEQDRQASYWNEGLDFEGPDLRVEEIPADAPGIADEAELMIAEVEQAEPLNDDDEDDNEFRKQLFVPVDPIYSGKRGHRIIGSKYHPHWLKTHPNPKIVKGLDPSSPLKEESTVVKKVRKLFKSRNEGNAPLAKTSAAGIRKIRRAANSLRAQGPAKGQEGGQKSKWEGKGKEKKQETRKVTSSLKAQIPEKFSKIPKPALVHRESSVTAGGASTSKVPISSRSRPASPGRHVSFQAASTLVLTSQDARHDDEDPVIIDGHPPNPESKPFVKRSKRPSARIMGLEIDADQAESLIDEIRQKNEDESLEGVATRTRGMKRRQSEAPVDGGHAPAEARSHFNRATRTSGRASTVV